MKVQEFNPLSLKSLGESVVQALTSQPVDGVPPKESFGGSGIYALYFVGDSGIYQPLGKGTKNHLTRPIYVGKAVPSGSRKGRPAFAAGGGKRLYSRIKAHARSIERAEDLDTSDFSCRYLVVAPVWIPLAEQLIVKRYSPLWNTVVDGFGNNNPGKGRYDQQVSMWDVLHRGRPWAEKLEGGPSMPRPDIVDLVKRTLSEV